MSEPTQADATVKRDRPFPWHCPKCRRKEVWRVTIPYDFQRRKNGNLTTIRIDALAVPRCNNCGELVIDYDADEQIRNAVNLYESRAEKVAHATNAATPAPIR